MPDLSQDDLARALAAAAESHHDYEQVTLRGARDEQWSGFYAAYVLGRFGDFAVPSALSAWLEAAPGGDHWPTSAAVHVLDHMSAKGSENSE